MGSSRVINDRYQLTQDPIGEGGMGIVYKAYDASTKRYVALKTMRGFVEPAALDLFTREWTVLSRISHPNIVDILDTGQFEEGGQIKPFFVMPLLPGATLDNLIRGASHRLTVDRVIEIITQVCKGLQAAHEKGLVHRDLKPSNIFVMDDDTAKIIDFGVAHLADLRSATGIKGTLAYMAPEQLEMQPPTPASDIFSLGVVCYEALTGHKPFLRPTESETITAIRSAMPPPASTVNSSVSQAISRVVHKAMAKRPSSRFSSAREFAECLQKARRNEAIDGLEPARFAPRLERAKKAFEESDFGFANEILSEVEAEGYIDPAMATLRLQIDQSVRERTVRQLLDGARARLAEDEFPLALQKLKEILELDPANTQALTLRQEAEKRRGEQQIENWLTLARQHLENRLFDQARQGLQEVFRIAPTHTRARELMAEVDRSEQEFVRTQHEKEELYHEAVEAYKAGEISTALTRLERILDLSRKTPVNDQDANVQAFYDQVRCERDTFKNAYTEARTQFSEGNLNKALEICESFLQKHPAEPMFQALKLEAEEQQRQQQSSFIAETNQRVEAESDLQRKLSILEDAASRYPNEPHFQQSLRLLRERSNLVNTIVARARQYEEKQQFTEALGQWDILRNIYSHYPGLDAEVERVTRRRETQVRDEAKARWVEQIDQHLEAGDWARAEELARNALVEFEDDRELLGLQKMAREALEKSAGAQGWLEKGQQACFDRRYAEGLQSLQKAAELDPRSPVIRAVLLSALLEHARQMLGQDWRASEPLVQQALKIDPNHAVAKSLSALVDDYHRQEIVEEIVCRARELQATGDLETALGKVEEGLATFPNELRLAQLRTTLRNSLGDARLRERRARHLQEMREIAETVSTTPLEELPRVKERWRVLAQRYPDDAEFQALARECERRAAAPVAPMPAGNSWAGMQPPTATVLPPSAPAPAPVKPAQPAGPGIWTRITAALAAAFGAMLAWPWKKWAVPVGVAIVILLIGASIARRAARPKAVTHVPAPMVMAFRTNVPAARITVDGKPVTGDSVTLDPGKHVIVAAADGYRTETRSIEVAGDAPPATTEFALAAEPSALRLVTDLQNGKAALDDQPPEDLQDSAFSKDALSAGDHKLKLLEGQRELLSVAFKAESGHPVLITGKLTTPRDVCVIAVSTLGTQIRLNASSGVQAGLKDQPPQPVAEQGLALRNPGSGPAELAVTCGKETHPVQVESANAPAVTLWAFTGENIGTVIVSTNIPEGRLKVDGVLKRSQRFRNGRAPFQLAPGPHKLQLVTEGYSDSEVKTVQVTRGVQSKVSFELKEIVRTATLTLQGATPGADVFIGETLKGRVGGDGSFRVENVQPGPHDIRLQMADHEPRVMAAQLVAGENTVKAQPLTPFGTLQFEIGGAAASVRYRRNSGEWVDATGKREVRVPGGLFDVEARNANDSKSGTVRVEPGKSVAARLTLAAAPPPRRTAPAPAPERTTADRFLDPKSWQEAEDGFWTHQGTGYTFLRGRQGVFVFDVLRPGKKLLRLVSQKIEWSIDWNRETDRIAYSLDGQKLQRRVYADGKAGESASVKYTTSDPEVVRLRIEITGDRVVVRAGEKGQDELVHTLSKEGRCGFRGAVTLKAISTP